MKDYEDEALKLALEALESCGSENYPLERKAITSLRKAIAEAEKQEQGEKPFYKVEGPLHVVCQCDKCKAKQEQGEPVALETVYETIIHWDEGGGKRSRRELARRIEALYTTPQQRTWVGLTDREKSNLWLESRAAIPRFHTYATLVEAKLKQKNMGNT
jgi:hypothetical protein